MPSRVSALAALLVALALPAAAGAQNPGDGATAGTARNFELVGHEPLFNRGMNAAVAVYHNYLYVGNRTDSSAGHPHPGLLVVDVSRPARPVVVNELPPEAIGQTTREMRVWPQQKLLMVMQFRCSPAIHACPAVAPTVFSIKFYDLSNPRQPTLVSTYTPTRQPHEMFLWADPLRAGRALLYISTPTASTNPATANLIVTDISGWRTGTFTEVAQANWNQLFTPEQIQTLDVALHSMSVSDDGTRTYLAYLGGGFFVLDTSDLASALPSPQLRLLTPIPNTPRWTNQTVHSAIPLPGRPFALTTDELYGDLLDNPENDHGCPWGWGHSIDVSDPANPRLIGEYRIDANTPGFCSTPAGQDDTRASYTAHNPTVWDDLAIISWHGGGLQAIDVSNPASPTQAGFFTPTPLASVATEDPALTTTGNRVAVWSFPIAKAGLVYVVDIRNGLYVLRYTGTAAADVRRTIFREGNSNLAEACPVVTVTPRRLREDRRARLTARVELFGHPVEKARVRLTGLVSRAAFTGAAGAARMAVRPSRPGTIVVRATNVAQTCEARVRVAKTRRPRGGRLAERGAPSTGRRF
jgi:hypothetical protein